MLPRGGSLPEDVWRRRHHFLLGLAWFHAIVIALIGPVLGYPLRLEWSAFFQDGTTNHTIAEASVVAFFALLALARPGRTFKATVVGLALMSASGILVHLSGGYIELHFHFFVMVVFLALYQDWAPYLIAITYVALHHGLVGAIAPAEVYNHPDAIAAPWKWAGIHAFFVLWAAVGSVIAWRFNEAAFARTKLILDVAGDGICGVDHDGKVTFANPAAQRMLGIEGEQIIGRSLGEVLGHSNAEGKPYSTGNSPIHQAMKQAATCVSSDEIFRRRDGTSFVVDYVSNPITEQGHFLGAVIAFTDVTNRKRAQEELQERYRQLTALHGIGQMIFASNDFNAILDDILDRSLSLLSLDLGNLRLLGNDGSMQLCACRGYNAPNRLGRQSAAVREGGRLDLMRRVASGNSVVIDEIADAQGLRSFKSEGAHSALIVPIITATEMLGVIEVASRTPRKFRIDEVRLLEAIGHQMGIAVQKARLMQEAERRAQELERSNADLQHFAYIASHDLQEPLRMVSSYMQLLSRRYKEKLDADADEFIGYAVDGAKRMQALINALLSYSRVGTQGKGLEHTDCEKVLDDTLAALKNAIEDSGAQISRGALPTVMADATQLGQLFQNLIANAIKFRNHHAPVVRISAERKGTEWVFTVADNGIGFDPEYADRVFVMFQRLHGRDAYPGTGIGLAVCKKIVERHGGKIWVDSKPGEGACFHFTLPA
ncbi:MAG TPA: ATP-binding protein [Candidatus Binatia bacterium]